MGKDVYSQEIGHRIITNEYLPESIRKWADAEKKFLRDNVEQDTTLLDVGCGHGRHIQLLKSACRKLIGIDHNDSMLERAVTELDIRNNDHISLLLADATALPFIDSIFDTIICISNTLGNIYGNSQIKALEEMKRTIKKNRQVIVSLYSENAVSAQKDLYKNVGLKVEKVDSDFVYTNLGFKSERFTRRKIHNLFSLAGYTSIDIKELTDISYIVTAN